MVCSVLIHQGITIVAMNAGSLDILLKIVRDAIILLLEVQVEEITQYSNNSPGKTGNSRFPDQEANNY